MRILFVHEVNYLTKPIYEMHEFPEYLATRGHEVGFLHFAEGWSRRKTKEQGFRSQISGRVVGAAKIDLFSPQLYSKGTMGRILMALRAKRIFRSVLERFKPDIVVSFAVPTSGWQALRVCKSRGIPYLFRALDVSHKIRKTPFSTLIRLAEKYIYRNADWISANNSAMAKYCQKSGAKPSLVSVEYPPMDLAGYRRELTRDDPSRADLGIPKCAKVAIYLGSFFYFSGLRELVSAFLESAKSDEYLLLVGGGEIEGELRNMSRGHPNSRRVIFTGFVPFARVPGYLQIADVALNPMLPTLVSNAALPNKVIQYFASGLPVVSTKLDGLSSLFGNLIDLYEVSAPEDVWGKAAEVLSAAVSESKQLNPRQVDALLNEIFALNGTLEAFQARIQSLSRGKF